MSNNCGPIHDTDVEEFNHRISDYLLIKEAAEFVGVSCETLRNWERRGNIRVYRHPLNNHRLYRKSHLMEYLGSIKKHPLAINLDKDKLALREAASYLKIATFYLINLGNDGKIPSTIDPATNKRVYKKADLDAYLETKRIGKHAQPESSTDDVLE